MWQDMLTWQNHGAAVFRLIILPASVSVFSTSCDLLQLLTVMAHETKLHDSV